MGHTIFVPGKIILCGEYAVIAGKPGIALPSSFGITAQWTPQKDGDIHVDAAGALAHPLWQAYIAKIVGLIESRTENRGTLKLTSTLPLGKGMGASTAVVVALCRAIIGDDASIARRIEDIMNPGGSGIDFAVIWHNTPLRFTQGKMEPITLPKDLLVNAVLIDTGTPDQTTSELIADIEQRKADLVSAFATIGACAERLLRGEPLIPIFHDHHRAQVLLGVVPADVQTLIADIERCGGGAKVIGAGSATGGGGIVLATHSDQKKLLQIVGKRYPVLPL